jgi:hypothetical protein
LFDSGQKTENVPLAAHDYFNGKRYFWSIGHGGGIYEAIA